MDLGSLVLLAFIKSQLTVVGDSHASGCPDPATLKELVAERLGDRVTTAHELHHERVTDAQSGQSYVQVRLFDTQHSLLLERLIPVQGDECPDVPLAIAVIVDNYFAGFQTLPPAPQAASGETSSHAQPQALAESAPPPTSQTNSRPVKHQAHTVSLPRWRGQVALALGSGLAPSLALGLDYRYFGIGYLRLNLQAQVLKTKSDEAGLSVKHASHALYLGSGVLWPLSSSVSAGFTPELGLHLQNAEVEADDVIGSGTQRRIVPSLGLRIDAYLRWTKKLWWGVGVQAHEWLSGPRFVISQANAPDLVVLPLPSFYWNADLHLAYWF